jgi:hypothetical protein
LDGSVEFLTPQIFIILSEETQSIPGSSTLVYTLKSEELIPWSSHFLRIQAVNNVGKSLKESETLIVTLTSPPRAPQNCVLKTLSISNTSITTANVS